MIEDTDAFPLQPGYRGKSTNLAQPLARARRKVEPGRIGAIDDVQIVVSRHDQDPLREPGV